MLTRYLNPRPRYYYFRFLKTNDRYLEILFPVSILTISLPSACDSALAYQILCESNDRRRSYDVILILQGGGYSVTNLLPVSGLATSHMSEGPRLSAYQISTRCINPRPRNYYFRFLKTNGRRLEILLPVSILTLLLPLARGFPSAYQILSKSDYPRQCYDVIAIFKMAAVSHVGFGLG